jgi:diguanylate cyclase
MTIPHEPWLVALSIAIAIQGSFVGLSLARELDSAEGFRRRLALAGSALTLATGVWSMHFVGMLAANFPSAIDYLVLPTLISFLICVLVVGAGVYAAHAWGSPALRIGVGGVGMGLGVSVMH